MDGHALFGLVSTPIFTDQFGGPVNCVGMQSMILPLFDDLFQAAAI